MFKFGVYFRGGKSRLITIENQAIIRHKHFNFSKFSENDRIKEMEDATWRWSLILIHFILFIISLWYQGKNIFIAPTMLFLANIKQRCVINSFNWNSKMQR